MQILSAKPEIQDFCHLCVFDMFCQADKMTNQKLPGVCWACNWVMKKVKKMITVNSTKVGVTMSCFSLQTFYT